MGRGSSSRATTCAIGGGRVRVRTPGRCRRSGGGEWPWLQAGRRAGGGQRGRHVGLGKDEGRGRKRLGRGRLFGRAVERQVIRHIYRQRARESLSGGGEKRI